MSKYFSNFILTLILGFSIASCANRGTPTGGEKDITPPIITSSVPENYSINFDTKEIKIYFDEYIKIKDLQKQLIISPPMDPEPEITPLGTASKYITIKIHDTLSPNTTYAFNFGESIVDNNEENPYPYYRYVFSTGDYIDSLSIGGYVKDAIQREPDDFISVMLYDVDSTFTDSIIYKQKPKYITNTLDSTTNFTLENLKAGKYLMVALKDENNNYTFQQKTDKIGFLKEYITVPSDSLYALTLFKEVLHFKTSRPQLLSGNKIAFGYQGDAKNMKLKLLSQVEDDYKSIVTKDSKTDSLYYWYKPNIKADSLVFQVSNTNYIDTVTVKVRTLEKDSLIVKPIESRALRLSENFELEANNPFESLDRDKISIIDKDSAEVAFTSNLDAFKNIYSINFDKTEENTYKMQFLPGAITDFFGQQNDTLNYNVRTKSLSDYGNIRVNLQNASYPIIIQLVNQQGQVEAEQYATEQGPIDFIHINPGKYDLRAIFDANGNGKYDPGNYLKQQQPERVSYAQKIDDVRAYYDQIVEFILK